MRREVMTAAQILDADNAPTVKDEARYLRPHHDGQVLTRQHRMQICRRGALAAPVADRHLHAREAVLPLAVIVIV